MRAILEKFFNKIITTIKGYSFEDITTMWFDMKKINYKHNTIQSYSVYLNDMNKVLGSIKIKKLTSHDINNYLDGILSNGHVAYEKRHSMMIRMILEFALNKKILNSNPMEKVKSIHVAKHSKRSLTTLEKSIINQLNINKTQKMFWTLLLYTGIRKSEALALNVSDINMEERYIKINKILVTLKGGETFIQESTKTWNGQRIVPIFADLYDSLKGYIDNHDNDILFANSKGVHYASNTPAN